MSLHTQEIQENQEKQENMLRPEGSDVVSASKTWQQNPFGVSVSTCGCCSSYVWWQSHCRFCGLICCTVCISILTDKLKPYSTVLCQGIPENKRETLKVCQTCTVKFRFRRFVCLWAKLLLRWYKKYGVGSSIWLTLAQKSPSTSLQSAAIHMLRAYYNVRSSSQFQFASIDFMVHDVEQQLAITENKLLFYDIVHRTNKYKSISLRKKRIDMFAPLPLLISATHTNFDLSIAKAFVKHYKPLLPILTTVISNEYFIKSLNRYIPLIQRLMQNDKISAPTNGSQMLGLAHVVSQELNKQIDEWKKTLYHIQTLINNYADTKSLDEMSCLHVAHAFVLYNYKKRNVSGIKNIKTITKTPALQILTTNDEEAQTTDTDATQVETRLVVCACNSTYLKAACFLDPDIVYHYKNLTNYNTKNEKTCYFVYKKQDDETKTNGVQNTTFRSQVILYCLLLIKGYLIGKDLTLHNTKCCVDANNNLILLDVIEQATSTTQPDTSATQPDTHTTTSQPDTHTTTTTSQIDTNTDTVSTDTDSNTVSDIENHKLKIKNKILKILKFKENTYWLIKIMHGSHEEAVTFGKMNDNEVSKHFSQDLL
tara:strand:+ start:10769 stop:12553 length:1785 start_codon:yes stop_codon:yes gene_type:complete